MIRRSVAVWRERRAREQWQRQWDSTARAVRSALAACAVEQVNHELERAHVTGRTPGEITAQVWGDLTNLVYPTTNKER